MEGEASVKQLLLQQTIPALPNAGPGAAAWLPTFAGSSWLAYGAGGSVVIRSAPSPSAGGDNSASSFFQQVISLTRGSRCIPEGGLNGQAPGENVVRGQGGAGKLDGGDESNVECVAWAPQGAEQQGALAAVCGDAVHILAPQNDQGSSPTDLPLFWRPIARLHHPSPVHAVAWTHSGDGLLSAGAEVAMWRPTKTPPGTPATWQRIWSGTPTDGPQVQTATTQTVESLVATAQGHAQNGSESVAGTPGRRKRPAWGRATETGHATVWWHCAKPADVSTDGSAAKKAKPQESLPGGPKHSRLAVANGAHASAEVSGAGSSQQQPLDDPDFDPNQELHAIVLPHPGAILSLQWRPQQGLRGLGPRRQALLTSCEDGIVRLWLEVEVRRGRQVAGSDSPSTRAPPRFYVGAIFEPFPGPSSAPSMRGCVYWAEENSPRGAKPGQAADVAGCEWLVGVRADGTVGLWAVHCLDDLHPPRTPRISKWDESPGLLSQGEVAPSEGARWQPSVLSCAIQRPDGGQGGPPTAVELCERVSAWGFRWARIWPPVLAIGGGGGHMVGGNGAPRTGGRKSWGVSMEDVRVLGLGRGVKQVAVHPSPAAALLATVDSDGGVVLWETGAPGTDSVAVPAVTGPFAIMGSAIRACLSLEEIGGDSGRKERRYSVVRWLGGATAQPASKQWLLSLRSGAVDLWEIARSGSGLKDAKLSLLSSLVPPEEEGTPSLDNFCIVPGLADSNDCALGSASAVTFRVLATGNSGRLLLGWRLDIRDPAGSSRGVAASWWFGSEESESNGHSGAEEERTAVEVCFLGSRNFGETEAVVDLDSEMSEWPSERKTERGGKGKELFDGEHSGPFVFATAHEDGSVRFWDVAEAADQSSDASWRVAGWTQVSEQGGLKSVRVAPGKGRIAVVIKSRTKPNDTSVERVQIWEGESCFGVGGAFTLEGELEHPASGNTPEVAWGDAHNGQLLLAVAGGEKLHVFVQGHSPRRDPESGTPNSDLQLKTGGWTCLAEAESPFERFRGLAWGPQMSLIAGAGPNLHLFGPWLTGKPSVSVLPLPPPETAAPVNAPLSKMTYKGGSYSQLSLAPSASTSSLPQLGLHSSSVPSLTSLLTPSSSYGSLSGAEQKLPLKTTSGADVITLFDAAGGVGAPLEDYHPRVLFHFMFEGNKRKARACLRHLAAGLHATSAKGAESSGSSRHFGRMHLSELVSLDEPTETSRLPSRRGSAVGSSSAKAGDKYASLMSSSWVDEEPGGEGDVHAAKAGEFVRKDAGELFTKAEAEALAEALATSVDVQGLTSDERVQLLAIIDALAELDGGSGTPRLALDAPAERFRMATRASTLAASRKRGRTAGTADITLPSMQMAWVLHSDTKEALLDACLPDPPTWPAMRALGAGFWHTNVTDLRARVEKAARAQFMEKKDPKDCALLYLALDRKTVLTGLFKLSRDERDKKLYEFLGRDFTQPAHRAAALKNSYVLMGQHRHELAAAFFLLGGSLDEAAGVCCKNLKDPQLALLVCRLREGADGPVGRDILKREILPSARESGDAWLASLLLWSLGNKIEALREVAGSGTPTEGEPRSAPILDPEVGDYCALLAGKPGLQQGPHAKEAAEIVKRATVRAAYAYDRAGLQLQALEHLPSDVTSPTQPEVETPKPPETPALKASFAPSASIESGTFSWGGSFGGAGGGSATETTASTSSWGFGSPVPVASPDAGTSRSEKDSNPWAVGVTSPNAETSKPSAETPEPSARSPKPSSENPWSFGSSSLSDAAEPQPPKPPRSSANPWAFGATADEEEAPAETSKPPPATSANPWSFGSSFAPLEESNAETSKPPEPPSAAKPNPWAIASSFTSFGDSEDSSAETSKPAEAPAAAKPNPWAIGSSFTSFGDEAPAPKPSDAFSFGGNEDAAAPAAAPAAKPSNPWSFAPPEEEEEAKVEEAEDVTKGPVKGSRIGDGWLGEQVVTGLRYSMRHRLTSQVVSPLLQQHPSWAMTSATSQEAADEASEEELLLEDVTLAVDRWRVDPQRLSTALTSLAHGGSRWSLFCRLVCGTSTASQVKTSASGPDLAALGRAFLAEPGKYKPVAGDILRALVHVLPRVVSVLVLASGAAAPARSPLPRQQLWEVLRVAEEVQALTGDVASAEAATSSREESVKKAGAVVALLLFLAAAWFGKRTQGLLALLQPLLENGAVPIALSSSPQETHDWIEGRIQKLTSSALREQGKAPDSRGSGPSGVQKEPPASDPLPPKSLVVSEADTWRVLSTCLWSQVLGAVRKQLSGPKPPEAFSDRSPGDRSQGFGWNSPSQEQSPLLSPHSVSPPASPPGGQKRPASTPPGVGGGIAGAGGIYSRGSTSKPGQGDEKAARKVRIEDGIVSALAGVQTGLRRQLAAHVKRQLAGAKTPPPLVAWLWENALKEETGGAQAAIPVLHLSKDPKDKEQAQQAALALLNQPKPRIPVPPLASRDPLEAELWRLVVDREKLRAALEMEGLPAPSPGLFKNDVPAAAAPRVTPLKDSPFVNKTKGSPKVQEKPETVLGYGEPQEVFTLPGELLESVCVNSVDPRQMVVATNRKGLVYADIRPGGGTPGVASAPASFAPMGDTLWGKSLWPSRGWPGTGPKTDVSPPSSTPPSSSQVGSYVSGMSVQGGVAGLGVGAGTWALGWDVDEGSAEDPIPLLDSVTSRTLAAHPLRPLFLVGSNNTHTYLWEFGREKASATYGVLPAVSGPPPYVIPSVERVKFDRYGHRFATAANDGTVSTWRLEVGGRSQTRADETRQCFSRHCSDLAFVGASGSVVAAAGLSNNNENLVLWDTLAPPSSSRAAVHCHDGGARCLAVIDSGGGGYPLIVSGGRGGDIIVHDFRYVASGRGSSKHSGQNGAAPGGSTGASGSPGGQARKPPVAEGGGSTSDRTVWSISRAHAGGVHTIEAVPGTSMFVTGGKDGEVKLWDAGSSRLVHTWERAHDKRTFLNARGGGAVMQAAVTLVLPLQDGMLSCGADGIVKMYPHQEIAYARSATNAA